MRSAQFYAIEIFVTGRLCPPLVGGGAEVIGAADELARKAIPLVETQSSSWSVSLYMIFFFCLSSGDGKAI